MMISLSTIRSALRLLNFPFPLLLPQVFPCVQNPIDVLQTSPYPLTGCRYHDVLMAGKSFHMRRQKIFHDLEVYSGAPNVSSSTRASRRRARGAISTKNYAKIRLFSSTLFSASIIFLHRYSFVLSVDGSFSPPTHTHTHTHLFSLILQLCNQRLARTRRMR